MQRSEYHRSIGEAEKHPTTNGTEVERRVAERSEEIHIRSFDISRSYNLTVRVEDSAGLVFARRYHLSPEKTVSVCGQLSPGEYEVDATLEGRRRRSIRCEIDSTPQGTALIEVGNGTISLTEGLYR
jgi:hypothetical protein